MNEILTDWLLPCLYAFFSCVGFCLIFNVHGPGIFVSGLGGALGWLVYLLCEGIIGSIFIRYALAAVAVTLYAELMARLRRCPVTGYLIVALLPFVPGSGIYEAMRYCVNGDSARFLSTLLRTFGLAGALALGALMGSIPVRMISPLLRRRPSTSSPT